MTPQIASTEFAASPQARLAASRKALIRQMNREGSRSGAHSPDDLQNDLPGSTIAPDVNHETQPSSTFQVIMQAMQAWWQHHPARLAVDMGRPFLNNYARSKPLQLVGVAAGLGAVLVLAKPWRVVSVTGLALAAVKSTSFSSSLLSLIPRLNQRPHSKKIQPPLKDTP